MKLYLIFIFILFILYLESTNARGRLIRGQRPRRLRGQVEPIRERTLADHLAMTVSQVCGQDGKTYPHTVTAWKYGTEVSCKGACPCVNALPKEVPVANEFKEPVASMFKRPTVPPVIMDRGYWWE